MSIPRLSQIPVTPFLYGTTSIYRIEGQQRADDLRVSITGANKERVELGFEPTYRFDVEKLAGRWQVVGFSAH